MERNDNVGAEHTLLTSTCAPPLLLLLIIVISSCAQLLGEVQPSFTATPAPQTIFGSPTPVVLNTVTASPNLTMVPTLPADEAAKRWLGLLSNNGICHLPCLWGITPGKSIEQEAQSILVPLESISGLGGFEPGNGSLSLYYSEGDLQINTSIAYLSNNQAVSSISLKTRIIKRIIAPNGEPGLLEMFDKTSLSRNINYYMLPNVLSQLGVPTSVVVSVSAAPPNTDVYGGFDMVLVYPDQGVLAHYTTQRQLIGEIAKGCFTNSLVELELFPAGDRVLFSEGLDSTVWAQFWPDPVDTPRWKPFEKVTGMSLEEFYETFRNPTDKCIETPLSLWTTSEP